MFWVYAMLAFISFSTHYYFSEVKGSAVKQAAAYSNTGAWAWRWSSMGLLVLSLSGIVCTCTIAPWTLLRYYLLVLSRNRLTESPKVMQAHMSCTYCTTKWWHERHRRQTERQTERQRRERESTAQSGKKKKKKGEAARGHLFGTGMIFQWWIGQSSLLGACPYSTGGISLFLLTRCSIKPSDVLI